MRESHRLLYLQALIQPPLHVQYTRAGITQDGITPILTRHQQFALKLTRLVRRFSELPLGLKCHATTKVARHFGNDDVKAGLVEQGESNLHDGTAFRITRCRTKDPCGAGRKIDHLVTRFAGGNLLLEYTHRCRLGQGWHPLRHFSATSPGNGSAHTSKPPLPQHTLAGAGQIEHTSRQPCGTREVFADPSRQIGMWRQTLLALLQYQLTGINTYRTLGSTQAIHCTGFIAGVAVCLVQRFQTFGILPLYTLSHRLESCYLTNGHDTLTRRQGKITRGANMFAKTALDTLVDNRIGTWQRLEILKMQPWVTCQYDVGVEHIVRIK